MGPELSAEYHRLDEMIKTDPDGAWRELVAFITARGYSLESQALLEDLVSGHAATVIDAIEADARSDRGVAEAIAFAHVYQSAGPAFERFRRLQAEVRTELGVVHWEGMMPLEGDASEPLDERRET